MIQHFITDGKKHSTFLPEINREWHPSQINHHLIPQSYVDTAAFVCNRNLSQAPVFICLKKWILYPS